MADSSRRLRPQTGPERVAGHHDGSHARYFATAGHRQTTRAIQIGGVSIGGGAPIVVQSMTKTDTRDVGATVEQLRAIAAAGGEIIRLAVPDNAAAAALPAIRAASPVPLIADIHFNYLLALRALEAGVDGLRLNPGNIRDRDKVDQVIAANPGPAEDYRSGKDKAKGRLVGEVMKASRGKANPQIVNELIDKRLRG